MRDERGDFWSEAAEATQGVQLNQMVPLISHKRTFVRVSVSGVPDYRDALPLVRATLTVDTYDRRTVTLRPLNDGDATLASKLHVLPPVWLDPARRGWVGMRVHTTYVSRPLSAPQVVRMEENVAEKISWLDRTTAARNCTTWRATRLRPLRLATHPKRPGEFDLDDIGARSPSEAT